MAIEVQVLKRVRPSAVQQDESIAYLVASSNESEVKPRLVRDDSADARNEKDEDLLNELAGLDSKADLEGEKEHDFYTMFMVALQRYHGKRMTYDQVNSLVDPK